MKLSGRIAAGSLSLLFGILGAYQEWNVLHCLRCGKWGLSRQLRFGPDNLFYDAPGADWAQHSVPLWTWRLDSGASLDPLFAKDDINAQAAPFPSLACRTRGHLWLAEQTNRIGLLIRTEGSCGMSWRASDAMFRGLDRWSDPWFKRFCRRTVGDDDTIRALLLPGDTVFAKSAFLAWDARLGKALRAYDASEPLLEPWGWTPANWEFAEARSEGTRFASWR